MSSAHNPFEFIRNRKDCISPSDGDLRDFDMYRCSLLASMSRQSIILNKIVECNTIGFYRLTPKQQCLAFTSFNGRYIGGEWHLPKKEAKMVAKEYVDQVMFVFDCSENDARSLIYDDLIDKNLVDSCYKTLTETQQNKRYKK